MENNLEAKKAWRIKRREERTEDNYYMRRLGDAEFASWVLFGVIALSSLIMFVAITITK